MIDNPATGPIARQVALRLVTAEGITLAQAAELVSCLGFNWSSLVREARLTRKDPV